MSLVPSPMESLAQRDAAIAAKPLSKFFQHAEGMRFADYGYMVPVRRSGHMAYKTGYGGWKFCHRTIRARAEGLKPVLERMLREHDAQAIVVRGTSGTYMAAALQMISDLPLVMLRKRGEDSHGQQLEGRDIRFHRYIILDDLIGGGSTVRDMQADLEDAECVAIVLHQYFEPGYRPTLQSFGSFGAPVYE